MFRRGAKCQCQVPVPGASAKCGHHVPDRTTHIPPCAADCLSQSGHEFIREVRKASERQSFSVLIESEPVSGFARECIARADTKHVRVQVVRRPHRRLASSHTRRRIPVRAPTGCLLPRTKGALRSRASGAANISGAATRNIDFRVSLNARLTAQAFAPPILPDGRAFSSAIFQHTAQQGRDRCLRLQPSWK